MPIPLLAACFLLWTLLSGFIPQGNQIADRMLAALGGFSILKVSQEITNPDHSTVSRMDMIRISADGTSVRSINDGQAVPLFPENSMERMEIGPMLPWCGNRESFNMWASRMGLQLGKSLLWRFEGRPVWVIGAIQVDEPGTQLWVDVDSFLPVRLLVSSDVPQQPGGEVRFSDWKAIQGIHYPYAIQVSRQGFILQDIRVQQIDAQPAAGQQPAEGQPKETSPALPEGSYSPSKDLKPVHQAIEEMKQRMAAPSSSSGNSN